MFSPRFTKEFYSQDQLIAQASKLRVALYDLTASPRDVPMHIVKLERLYRRILVIDFQTLSRHLNNSKNNMKSKEAAMKKAEIGKLLRCDNFEGAERYPLLLQGDALAWRVNEVISYARERKAYVHCIKNYLEELKSDIIGEGFLSQNVVTPEPIMQIANMLSSVNRKSILGVLGAYHDIILQLDLLGSQEQAGSTINVFCHQQQEKIAALRYLKLVEIDATSELRSTAK